MTMTSITITAETVSSTINPDTIFNLLTNKKITVGYHKKLLEILLTTKKMSEILPEMINHLQDDEILILINHSDVLLHQKERIILRSAEVSLCTARKGDVFQLGASQWLWNGTELICSHGNSVKKFSTKHANIINKDEYVLMPVAQVKTSKTVALQPQNIIEQIIARA